MSRPPQHSMMIRLPCKIWVMNMCYEFPFIFFELLKAPSPADGVSNCASLPARLKKRNKRCIIANISWRNTRISKLWSYHAEHINSNKRQKTKERAHLIFEGNTFSVLPSVSSPLSILNHLPRMFHFHDAWSLFSFSFRFDC